MNRRRFIKRAAMAAGAVTVGREALAGAAPARRPNLLFLMTDQQQSLALSLAGNRVLKTPNLDKLAKSGAWFTSAYSACPVCVPARTSILTGRSIHTTGVLTNEAYEQPRSLTGAEGIFSCQTFDEILADNGYITEYYGKWHTRLERAKKYANAEQMAVKITLQYRQYAAANKIPTQCPPGELMDLAWNCPYIPDPMDVRHSTSPEVLAQLNVGTQRERAEAARKLGIPAVQGGEVGKMLVPPEHSVTAYVANGAISSLERLAKQDKPFSITCSIPPPHPPYLACSPYQEMYPAKEMPLPASFRDPMVNSPYEKSGNRIAWCQNPDTIGYLISNYYGMLKEIDDWIGKITDTLDRLQLRDNTLVVFLSDHGEMLGAHGMYSKMVFLDESSHVPMMLSFPGRIAPGTVVSDAVGHIDIFATILDYLGVPAPASEGVSMRALVEGRDGKRNPFTVSEWPPAHTPSYMVSDKQWKFMYGCAPETKCLDALYDLKNDPYETRNLIGSNPDRNRYKSQAEAMKDMLLAWLRQVHSPDIDGVTRRGLVA